MSKRNKFRSEDKLRIAIECSEGKKRVSEAGREIGAGEMAIKYNVSTGKFITGRTSLPSWGKRPLRIAGGSEQPSRPHAHRKKN